MAFYSEHSHRAADSIVKRSVVTDVLASVDRAAEVVTAWRDENAGKICDQCGGVEDHELFGVPMEDSRGRTIYGEQTVCSRCGNVKNERPFG